MHSFSLINKIFILIFISLLKDLTRVTGDEIESPRVTNMGKWGSMQNCPAGKYVFAMKLKTESNQGGDEDDTALNGIRLYCGEPNPSGKRPLTSYIYSNVGKWGKYGLLYSCKEFAIGFQLRSETHKWRQDDTAANNLRLICSTGETLTGDGQSWGSWTKAQKCEEGEYICGIRTQVEPGQGSEDDTSLNNVDMQCCPLSQ